MPVSIQALSLPAFAVGRGHRKLKSHSAALSGRSALEFAPSTLLPVRVEHLARVVAALGNVNSREPALLQERANASDIGTPPIGRIISQFRARIENHRWTVSRYDLDMGFYY